MNRAQALEVLSTSDTPETKVADVYDDSEQLREALSTLIPDFEYPNYSHLTLAQVQRRVESM